MGGLKDLSAGEEGGTVERLFQRLAIHLFTEKNVHLEGFTAKKNKHTFSITSSSIEPCSPICDLGTLHYSVILQQYVETTVFK